MEQTPNFHSLFNHSTCLLTIIDLDFNILDANESYLSTVNQARNTLVGENIFRFLLNDPDASRDDCIDRLRLSMERVVATRKADFIHMKRYPVAADRPDAGLNNDRLWGIVNTPIFDANGKLESICHSPIPIEKTDLMDIVPAAENAADAAIHDNTRLHAAIWARHTTNQAFDAERDHFLQRVFEQMSGFVAFVRGPDHVFELVSHACRSLIGKCDVIGRPFGEAFPGIAAQGFTALLGKVYASGKPDVAKGIHVEFLGAATEEISEARLDFVCQPVRSANGNMLGIFIQGHEMSSQQRAEEELLEVNNRWKKIMESSGEGVWEWHLESNEIVYSKCWYEMLGYTSDDIEHTIDQWKELAHPDDAPRVTADIIACLKGKTVFFNTEYRAKCKDGHWAWLLSRGMVVKRDKDGKSLHLIGSNIDISAKKESEEQLWQQANFDALTGLPNRRLFRDRLDQEVKLSQRTGLPLALLFIDLDYFKQANDMLGHDAGDLLLKQAADRINASVRASDTVARLGGDEFTVILSELDDVSHVESVAQKILEKLSRPYLLGTEVIYMSGSVGITLYPDDALNAEDLIRNADQAMYAAKSRGRNQFSYFTRSMQNASQYRMRLISDLRQAIKEGDQLKVYYQPIIDMSTGNIVKAEALLRWFHPTLGLIAPSDFIPLAEESGLIHALGDWVFKEAALWSLRWGNRMQAPFPVSVNKSPLQFNPTSNQVNWPKYLHDLGLPKDSIFIEITEGTMLKASNNINAQLLQYRDAGIQVAIDDFGSGFSSMSYLKKFDIDILKIDHSFIQDITSNKDSRAIAETIILMAHKLGLKVIAEGIETYEQNAILLDAGCDFGQGFLYAKAVSPEAFEHLLRLH